MAAYDLEEQEQISQIKAWWDTYGNLVTGIALAAAVAAVGWQGWNWYQGKQSGEASVLYAAVQKAAAEIERADALLARTGLRARAVWAGRLSVDWRRV